MSDILKKTHLPFSELGVSPGKEIESLFRQVLDKANEEAKSIGSPEDLESFRVRWTGRKNSVLSRIQDNWLVPAPSEQKKWVGAFFNSYKNEIISLIDHHKKAVEVLEMEAPARGATDFDLSLPGVVHPI